MKIQLAVLHIICKQTDTHRHIKYNRGCCAPSCCRWTKNKKHCTTHIRIFKPVANWTRREEICL